MVLGYLLFLSGSPCPNNLEESLPSTPTPVLLAAFLQGILALGTSAPLFHHLWGAPSPQQPSKPNRSLPVGAAVFLPKPCLTCAGCSKLPLPTIPPPGYLLLVP